LRKNILLALVVVAVCDVLFAQVAKLVLPASERIQREQERLYRVKSNMYHHDLAKNASQHGVWGGRFYPIFTNSLGFKDREVREVPIQSEDWRILFIGDSFTEGIGLRYEDTFIGLLDDAFHERNIRTLNAGVVSYSPSIYYRKVKYLLEDVGLDFDELVVFIDISDIEDEARYYDIDANDHVVGTGQAPRVWAGARAPFGLRTFLKENSVIVRLADLAKDFEPGQERLRQLSESDRSAWTVDEKKLEAYGRRGIERSIKRMNQLLAVLRKHAKPLTVVVYPWPTQIIAGDFDSVHIRTWREWCEKNGVQFIDLFPEFFKRDKPMDVLQAYYDIPWDVHFNEQGNALVAEAFFARFVSAHDRPPARGRQASQSDPLVTLSRG